MKSVLILSLLTVSCSGYTNDGSSYPRRPFAVGDTVRAGDSGGGDGAALDACQPASAVYFTDVATGEILRMDPDGSNLQTVVTGTDADDIAIDPVGGKIYWPNNDLDIMRANLDGSSVETVLAGEPSPYSLALNLVERTLFWTNQTDDPKVARSDLTFTNRADLVSGSGCCVIGITVDVVGQRIYWMDGYYAGTVSRAALDGGNPEVIGNTVGIANGIDVDPAGGKVYWTEYGNGASDDVVRRANLDGSNVETLLSASDGLQTPQHIAVDSAAGQIYFTDLHAGRVQRANLDGSSLETLVTSSGYPRGIALLRNDPCM